MIAPVHKPDLSVIIVVDGRRHETEEVYLAYRDALAGAGELEFIYVLDGANPTVEASLIVLRERGEPVRILPFPRSFGGAACLREGVKLARAGTVALLTPYLQVEPSSLPDMLAALEDADLVVAKRDRKADSAFNKARGKTFSTIARLAGSEFSDLGCHARIARRDIFPDLPLHDEFQIFLPLLAERAGFKVRELTVPQAASDTRARLHKPGLYIDQTLDLVSLAFLMRFLQKPFRFFGSLGGVMVMLGVLIGAWLVYEKFAHGIGMDSRPLLSLAVLLMVVGVQVAIAGLIAEIIIFTRTDDIATYKVAEVVEHKPQPGDPKLSVVSSQPV